MLYKKDDMINLKNTEVGYRFLNFKKCSCFYVFDNLSFIAFKKLNKNLNQISKDSVEIKLNKNINKNLLKNKYGYIFVNKWYQLKVPRNTNTAFNKNVILLNDREQIKELIENKQYECAMREPAKFDENKKDTNWINFGKEVLAVKLDNKILGMLTFTEEPNKNLRLRLLYTIKNYKRHGVGAMLIEHGIKIAKARNLKTLTICIDNSEGTHIENLALNNKFKHNKNGYVKILK